MAKFIDKLKDKIFEPEDGAYGDDGYGDEYDDDIQYEEYEPLTKAEARREEQKPRKVVPLQDKAEKPGFASVPGTGSMKMILFQPLSYEDSQAIVDNLRAKKPVIVNMVDLEREVAQRVLDFMAGAVYAVGGTIRRVAYGIFVIVPSNVSIVGSGENEEKELFNS